MQQNIAMADNYMSKIVPICQRYCSDMWQKLYK